MEKLTGREIKLSTLVLGIAIGGAIGVAIGILFAPDKGSETRMKHAAFRRKIIGLVKEKFTGMFNGVAKEVTAS
jgi:gas vesicle protein